jgi:hypothetical protein
VREDGLEVLARNRADLLKSITEGFDYEEEAGHYLVSVENIIRSGMNYEATNDDLICLKAVTEILKQTLSPQELIDYLESTEEDVERTIDPRGKPSAYGRNISRLLPQHMTSHHYKDRMTGGHDIGMAHGKWPGAKPDEDGHYSIHHPFHEDIHPMRIKNAVSGRPRYESMLFEKYFGHDNTPWWSDDFHENMADRPEEDTFAKQAMNVEDAHEKHHRKLKSPIYNGVDKGGGDISYSFLGGPTTNDVKNPYDHMESTRMHDYERWKEEAGTDMNALEKKFSGLSEDDKERAMQMQHFKDRMDKMSLGGTTTTTVDPTEGMSTEETYDFINQFGAQAAEPYPVRHSHSMGWDTLKKGMYFLKPEDRTKILQHLDEHGSDDPEHQLVKLSDGNEFPMTRLKKNLEMNAGPEKNWFSRSHAVSAPNVPKTIESESDSKFKGSEGGIATALRNIKIDDTTTAYDNILNNMSSLLNGDAGPDDIHEIPNLFTHDEYGQRRLKSFIETSESPAKAFRDHANNSNEAQLTRNGFLSLVGYDSSLNPLKEHPSLPSDLYSGPLLSPEVVKQVLGEYDNKVSLGMQSKDIKNGYGFIRSGFNAPRVSDLPDGHKDHYITMDGKMRGLSHLATKYYADRGGLGRDPATYGEFIHNHHKYGDGDDSSFMVRSQSQDAATPKPRPSELGRFSEEGQESLLGGVKSSILEPRTDTVGLYGGLHITPLMPGQRTPMSPLQILSRYGVSRRDIEGDEKARSSHNNYTDELSTHFPTLLSSVHSQLPNKNTHFQKYTFNRETASDFQQHHPYAGIGSELRGDSSLMNRSAAAHRLAFALGRYNDPLNPSDKFVHTYKDLYEDPQLAPRPQKHADFLQHLGDARKVIADTESRRNLMSEANDILERINDIESGVVPSSRREADLQLLRGDLDKLRIMERQYQMNRLTPTGRDASINTRFSREFSDKLEADKRITAEYAKEKLLPMILEKNPDAFNTGNPLVAMANAMRLAHDASRGLMLDGNHDLETFGYHEKEATMESTEQNMARSGKESPHKQLATMLRDNAVELNPEMKVDEAMKLLEMPELGNDNHRDQVEQMLGKLVGPTKAATFGQIMRSGGKIHTQDFSDYKNIDKPMREHIGDFEEHPYSRASIPLNRGVPEYGALNLLNQMDRSTGDMTSYGLQMHPHPLPPKKIGKKGQLWESSQKTKAYHQAMSNHIYTFDEGQSGPLEEASAGSVTKLLHDRMKVPARPVHEMEGNVITPVYNSGRMDFGHSMSPTVGVEYDSQGNPMVGENMSDSTLLNSISMPWMNYVFGNQWSQDLYSQPGLSQISGLQNNQMAIQPETGIAPIDDPNSVAKLFKAELPKEVPLIDPLHRIFEIKDMEELRGFTGEWVISKYHEGQRVKVKKKGSRIDITDEDGEKVGVDDSMRGALRKVCERDYVIDGMIVGDDIHINDILLYDDTDVTDLTTRERVKLIRGQFDSHEPVHVPSPESIRVTDDVGFEEAIKDLGADGQKLLLRDAKSTYMKGEERHPKWVLLAKAEEDIHIPFAMEMDRGHFIIHLPEDLVKYEIVDDEPVNPIAAIGSITKSDYSLRLANSLEPYWRQGFKELLKEELDRADWDEDKSNEGMTDERAKRIEHQSGGILKPKKDKNVLLKPKDTLKALLLIEKALEKLEKAGHYPMSGGRALGIDVGSDIASPRGPTSLTSEHAVPDWDMKERPEQDPEKPSDYPKKPKQKKEKEEQYDDLEV